MSLVVQIASADFPGTFPKILIFPLLCTHRAENKGARLLARLLLRGQVNACVWEEIMLSIHTEHVADAAVVECEGRIVHSEAVFKLRDAVLAQTAARIVVLDLSEVDVIGGGGLGMLAFLQRWAYAHNIRLKLFNPRSVRDRLEYAGSIPAFEIATVDEMIALLARADDRYALAS